MNDFTHACFPSVAGNAQKPNAVLFVFKFHRARSAFDTLSPVTPIAVSQFVARILHPSFDSSHMPPPKRRRSSESLQLKGEEAQKNPTDGIRPHVELWFTDGSIVLATDVHLYRVHKGMLARYSGVLNDIFEMPTEKTELWEDVPIVEMVGDTDHQVCLLLHALYDRQ